VPAVRCLREAIRVNPDSAQAHFQLGRTLRAGNARKEALTSLRSAAELAPDNVEIGYTLGVTLRELGRLREASAALIRAAAAAPNDARVQDELADTLAALKTPNQGMLATPAVVPKAPIPSENTDGGFTGDLAIFSLPELMEFLSHQKASGELQVRSGEHSGTILLHEGAITGVTYPGGKNLGQLLVESELITRTDLKQSMVRMQDLERDAVVAQVVVGRGLVDRAAVQEFLRRRVLEGISELVGWRTGSVLFRRNATAQPKPEVEVDVRWVLLEAMRRLDEDKR